MSEPSDAEILAAVGGGARTAHVADRLKMLLRRPYILRRLKRLEAQGLVVRQPHYTYATDIYWVKP